MSDLPPSSDPSPIQPAPGEGAPLSENAAERDYSTLASPSALFISRPIATSLLMMAIFLVGAVGFQYLPLSALPEVDYPTIQVQTFYPGASPDVMTSTITAPLERQFGEMPGLSRMSSVSSAGASIVTLQFSLDLTLDIAEQEVPGRHQRLRQPLAIRHPQPPDLRQG